MKRIFLLITGLLALNFTSNAQAKFSKGIEGDKARIKKASELFAGKSLSSGILNGDLETWVLDSIEASTGRTVRFMRPDGWAPLNGFLISYFFGTDIPITAVYDVASSNTSARIEIDTMNFGSDLATIFPANERVSALRGKYEFNGSPSTAYFDIFATKYDPIGDSSTIVGIGRFEPTTKTTGSFVDFVAPVTYLDPTVIPDTFYVFATYLQGDTATWLKFDDLKVDFQTTGIEDVKTNKLVVYPNPSSNQIKVSLKDGMPFDKGELSILGMDGAVKLTINNYKPNDEIDLSSLGCGMYIIKLIDGNTVLTQKINKI
jgi:hypothetical protein